MPPAISHRPASRNTADFRISVWTPTYRVASYLESGHDCPISIRISPATSARGGRGLKQLMGWMSVLDQFRLGVNSWKSLDRKDSESPSTVRSGSMSLPSLRNPCTVCRATGSMSCSVIVFSNPFTTRPFVRTGNVTWATAGLQ